LELKIDSLESWKDKQPCYILNEGKWEIVPGCFNGDEEIKAEDLI
jgi:hypothetical protein